MSIRYHAPVDTRGWHCGGSEFDALVSSILLLRHADAGSKDSWIGDDRERPLSEQGRSEAIALVPLLGQEMPQRLITSPLLRCRQTIEPFATRTGLRVEVADELGPTATDDAAEFIRRLAVPGTSVVLCTHGEVIEALQERLECADGIEFAADPRRDKGSAWSLRLVDGRIVHSEYHPTPQVTPLIGLR